MGAATARLLAAQGAKLVLGARGQERLTALAEEVGGIAVPTDVSRREDVQRLVDTAVNEHGRLDVLVSNAGIGPTAPFDALRVDDWEALIDINFRGVLYGIAAALPVFRRQERGHFVHTSSTAAHRIVPGMGVYAATKTAVNVVSECLRQEAGPNLRVTVVSPGMTATDFVEASKSDETDPQLIDAFNRIAMPPEAVARAIAYALEQPPEVDVGEIIIRPTAQA